MSLLNFLFGKNKNKSQKKVSEPYTLVNYNFFDTLIFHKLADEKFCNHPILLKSKHSFFKIFNDNNINKLKNRYSERTGRPTFFKQNHNTYEMTGFDITQGKEIKVFWNGFIYKDFLEGFCEGYREDGSIFMRSNFVDNEFHGLRQIFDVDGNVWENAHFINGIELGLKIRNSFYDEGFNREEMYDHNEGTGIVRGLYNDGNIFFEEEYLNGEKAGLFKKWYQNGNLKYEHGYNNGILDGVYNVYYENGNLKEKGNFKQSMRLGNWKEYDNLGNLTMSEKWEPLIDLSLSKCLERKCFNDIGDEVDCPELTNIRETSKSSYIDI